MTFKKGQKPWCTGKKMSQEHKDKLSQIKKQMYKEGKITYGFKKGKDVRREATMFKKGVSRPDLIGVLNPMNNPIHVIKAIKSKPISGLEKKFILINDKYDLGFEYVGDGKIIIENKCPDFIHKEKPIIIEIYCNYLKSKKETVEEWKNKRADLFWNYGFKTYFFNEHEITSEKILGELQ